MKRQKLSLGLVTTYAVMLMVFPLAALRAQPQNHACVGVATQSGIEKSTHVVHDCCLCACGVKDQHAKCASPCDVALDAGKKLWPMKQSDKSECVKSCSLKGSK